jgi:hypothetical protein
MSGGVEQAASGRKAVTALCGRAEDGVQRIAFGREWVTIARRIAGLETSVNVPTESYRGVVLQAAADGRFRILMRHVDPGLDVAIADAPDDAEVIADWRRYGRMTGLPLLVEDAEGRLSALEELRPVKPAERRYGSPLKLRRPRFLALRETGCAATSA